MRDIPSLLTLIAGAILFAAVSFLLLAAPGFLCGQASTVPIASTREVRR